MNKKHKYFVEYHPTILGWYFTKRKYYNSLNKAQEKQNKLNNRNIENIIHIKL